MARKKKNKKGGNGNGNGNGGGGKAAGAPAAAKKETANSSEPAPPVVAATTTEEKISPPPPPASLTTAAVEPAAALEPPAAASEQRKPCCKSTESEPQEEQVAVGTVPDAAAAASLPAGTALPPNEGSDQPQEDSNKTTAETPKESCCSSAVQKAVEGDQKKSNETVKEEEPKSSCCSSSTKEGTPRPKEPTQKKDGEKKTNSDDEKPSRATAPAAAAASTTPQKTAGGCCGSKKAAPSSLASEDTVTAAATAPASTSKTQSLSPSSGGGTKSCCGNKKQPAAPATAAANALTTTTATPTATCCGCGDNCRCCIENGWAYCQCGPNCTCSNPLLAEQASKLTSLVQECTNANNNTTTSRTNMEQPSTTLYAVDPLQAPTSAPPPAAAASPPRNGPTSTTASEIGDVESQSPNNQENASSPSPPNMYVDMVVGGMTCTMCSQAITNAMNAMEEIQEVNVSLSTDVAHVEFNPSLVKDSETYNEVVEKVQDTIADIGYMIVDVMKMPTTNIDMVATTTDNSPDSPNTTTPMSHNADNNNNTNSQQDRWNLIAQRQEEKLQQRKHAFLWSLWGTVPILFLTMIVPHVLPASNSVVEWWHHQHITVIGHRSIPLESLVLWLLATPVQFICGWEFYKSSYYGMFRPNGTLGMDVLVVLGTTASYGYALYATWSNHVQEAHFFETSAVLISFVLLGKWMQAAAVHRTSDALSQLMQLQPSTAIRVLPLAAAKLDIPLMDGTGRGSDAVSCNWNPLVDAYREETIPTNQLQRGDVVKIIPGASLPADGAVLVGELAVDESMVTGESLPVLKTKGSIVLGGTVCVESSSNDSSHGTNSSSNNNTTKYTTGQVAFCQVTGVGASTALAQIIKLVQNAQASKVPMQNFADTVSSIFVPVVVTLSVVTFLVWYALCSSGVVPEDWYTRLNEDAATFSLMFGIACLVISCPCALGLATPTAVMVGTGMGAKLGILMKGGEALEAASQVNAVVLDKTGTCTTGKPVVTDFVSLAAKSSDEEENGGGSCCSSKKNAPPSASNHKPLSRETILWLLGSLERSSEHPLARAIVSYAEQELSQRNEKNKSSYLDERPFLQPSQFRSSTGRGASGYMTPASAAAADGDGCDDTSSSTTRYFVAVGNRAFFAALEMEVTLDIDARMKALEEQGKTAILAAVDGQFVVVMGVADELRPDAAASVAYLRNVMKIDVWMVTGDNARTACAIAQQLNLPPQRVVSEALPNAKVHQVRKLQQQHGKIVCFVGDGVNDSPALAQANVGISMGTGAAIAAEASDMVLVRGQYVADVCTAIDLCRVIFARIQWNFVWSLLYNCLGIPLAAGICFPLLHTRVPPTVAAIAMALSSVSVVFSSLALRLYQPPTIGGVGGPSFQSIATTTRSSEQRRAAAAAAAGGSPATADVANASATRSRLGQVTNLSLDTRRKKGRNNTTASSSELTQPLLAHDHLPTTSAATEAAEGEEENVAATSAMEEGRASG
jgi:Cu+-exporting ATPase